MTALNSYTVLFIDDHCEGYLSSLEPAAKSAGIDLYATDNVLDGLEFLNEYADTIQAVILDLSFPKGEMQGMEALMKIKKRLAYLPVIMFTDSSSAEDIEKVVECIKKGAYNYVTKRPFNPVYLFQVVQSAIKHASLQTSAIYRSDAFDKKEKFFTVKKECSYGRFNRLAEFGFQLISINRPYEKDDAASIKKAAIEWHLNLLKTISIIYRDEVKLNLKYISENQKIKCLILFSLYAPDDIALDLLIKNVQHDITPFFTNSNDKDQPYLFEEISDEAFLTSANEISNEYKYNVFYRKPLKADNKSIGFTGTASSEEISDEYKPDELFPLPAQLNYDNELFKALLNQKEYAEIDVELIPKHLMKQEIDFIKQAGKNITSLETKLLSFETLNLYSEYLKHFIIDIRDKFLISVICKRKSTNWERHLNTAIENYFFGTDADVGYRPDKPETLKRFCTSDKGTINQLPFFYSVTGAVQAFRLPIPELTDLPGINAEPQIFHDAPESLSKEGTLLGTKKMIAGNTEIRISEDSLARHVYIMGQTGTGKSTLLKTMISDCLKKNEGFAVIDPHGDLFDDVLKMMPKSRKKSLYIINPTDAENSFGLNPLSYDETEPQAKSLVINELIRAFASFYDMKASGGPMFETYFKNGMLLVLDDEVQQAFGRGTLSDVVKVFHNEEFRNKLLKECGDENIRDFFKSVTSMTYEYSFKNFAPYITSKLTRFVEDYYLAPVLTSKKRSVDFRALMDAGSILLVRMDKGRLGIDNTGLLGQIVLSNIFLSAMSRSNIAKEDRKPYNIFIDEFQNFIKTDAGDALSEVRKYGLKLILANQTLGQLDDRTIESLLGNVGSLIFFRPGINDYEKIRHYLEPDFKREDVLKLPNFNCIARLLIDNIPSNPFVFQTINE